MPEIAQSHPKVSVCICTYNQAKYIRESIESVLTQRTKFEVEILVWDDASTDATPSIVRQLAAQSPHRIRANLATRNVGAPRNMYSAYRAARGAFIAHLDGDDLMRPDKLARQVEVLERNPGLVACTHDLEMVDSESISLGRSFRVVAEGEKSIFDLYATLPFFGHSSKMFRRDVLGPLHNYPRADLLDIEIHVEQAKHGPFFHLREPLGAYRESVGVSASTSQVNPILPQGARRVFEDALTTFPESTRMLKRCYAKTMSTFAYQSAVRGDPVGYKQYIAESLAIAVHSPLQVAMAALALRPELAVTLARYRDHFRRSSAPKR